MFENKEELPGFFKSALTIRGSASPRIIFPLAIFVAYATLVTLVHEYIVFMPEFNLTPFELFGAFLGVVLVFRTNAGYDRWWEARKIWGGIVNQCRNLVVGVLSYGPKNSHDVKRFIELAVLFPVAAKNLLRQNDQKNKFDSSNNSQKNGLHEPAALALQMGNILHSWRENNLIDPMEFLTLDEDRKKLIDYIGACERILKTPMPLVYAIKVRRFVLVFLALVPIAIVWVAGLKTPIVTLLVAYPLLGLDRIGKELQNPFSKNNLSHLPLDTICSTIEKDAYMLSKFQKNISQTILSNINKTPLDGGFGKHAEVSPSSHD